MSAEEIDRLIETTYTELRSKPVKREHLLKYQIKVSTRILPESLIIMEFVEKTVTRDKPGRMIRLG